MRVRDVRDPYLPPDHDAFIAAEPPTGRIIVIAPTRAACETIELGFTLDIETLLWREHSAELTELFCRARYGADEMTEAEFESATRASREILDHHRR